MTVNNNNNNNSKKTMDDPSISRATTTSSNQGYYWIDRCKKKIQDLFNVLRVFFSFIHLIWLTESLFLFSSDWSTGFHISWFFFCFVLLENFCFRIPIRILFFNRAMYVFLPLLFCFSLSVFLTKREREMIINATLHTNEFFSQTRKKTPRVYQS